MRSKSFRKGTLLTCIILTLALVTTGFPLDLQTEASAEDGTRTYEDNNVGQIEIEGRYIAGEVIAVNGEGINANDRESVENGDVMTVLTGIDINGPFGFEKHISLPDQDNTDAEETEGDYGDDELEEVEPGEDGMDSSESDEEDYYSDEPENSDYEENYDESDNEDYDSTDDDEDIDDNEIVLGAPGKYRITAHYDKYKYDEDAVSPEKKEIMDIVTCSGSAALVFEAILVGEPAVLLNESVKEAAAESLKGDWEKTDQVDFNKTIKVKGEIIFDPVKGESEQVSKYYAPKESLGKIEKPVWNEHKFVGWYTKKKAGKRVNKRTQVRFGDNDTKTFYAHWISKTRIIFKAGKGRVGKKIKKVWRNKKYGKLPKAKRKGYKFSGWYTKKRGGKKITAKKRVPGKNKVVLYAHWTKKVKILFKPRKGRVSRHYKKRLAGSRYGKLPKAKRKGYKFKGWYTKRHGGKKIYSSSRVPNKSKVRLYAHWKKKKTHRRHVEYVYITGTGKKYHRYRSCRGLNRANWVDKVTLTDALLRGLDPCSICGY